ncbi:protein of unknown function [Lentzea albidocapillata subsp. violacea]|uniref:DUF4360 domain-containing protein n=1 Tax=Lentzea albidocapillata subsp. violacea TaxID=128104 RepID=A0A1G9QSY0_9PSEU|nr:DUF4360 domain-containing protein [Lentzea albidocapillata]SDM13395.1 protein of unknown function [Lentzea albidocapillata subsp. violacea]
MLTTAAAALVALSALAPAGQPAPFLEVVTVNGSGCPAGDADVETDDRTFTIGYHTFLARAGSGSSPLDQRKNCQVNLRVNAPQGYTYGLARTTYEGYAHLQDGATGLSRVSTYLQGTSPTATVTQRFTGPFSDSWQTRYRPDATEIQWVPCGEQRNININAEVRVTLGAADPDRLSFVIVESSRGFVRTRRC